MQKYHVSAGLFGIYVGTLKNEREWKDKSNCTDEALEAVRTIYATNSSKMATFPVVMCGQEKMVRR